MELGKHTWHIEKLPTANQKTAALKFHEELDEVAQDLADYLEIQDTIADGHVPGIKFDHEHLFEGLPSGQRDKIAPFITDRPLSLQFVTLNYTGTLQKIFPHRNIMSVPSGLIVRDIHHLHGTLTENMTLGLSNESQFYNGMPDEERDDLIKPRLIASMNDGRIDTFERILSTSLILILFGTSLGESDKYIWEHVIQWLTANPSRYIIIHQHDSNYTDRVKRTSRGQKQFNARAQNKLLDHSTLSDEQKTAVKNRIFVIHNTRKLFAKQQASKQAPLVGATTR